MKWVDTTHQTFIVGGVYLEADTQGNPTCTLDSQTNVTAGPWPRFGTLEFTTEKYLVPWCQTPIPFQVARYTWGTEGSFDQDTFTLQFSTQDGANHSSLSFTAELARITITAASQSGPGSNPPLTATANLTNGPPGAKGYDWQIIGGNGAIVFPNGQERMSSTTNSISIEEPNPTGSNVSFTMQVGVQYPTIVTCCSPLVTSNNTTAASDDLFYGPSPDTFCG